ncbi:MAG TPA: hypothetical protein VN842_01975 [Thermoplasmata archaeon]|nr:hypothetical protein [Thermoplasmata archaeon]
MHRSTWDPPAESVTQPDQLDEGALNALDLLDGERIARCWRTGVGFLVMTNLRYVHVWRRPELFTTAEWHQGPSFFFYSLAPPGVIAGRFLQLVDQGGSEAPSARFLVRHPEEICQEIELARPRGRLEWERRRAVAKTAPRPATGTGLPPEGPLVHEIVREVVKVRCRFCGNLMDVSAVHCPACGAPQG